MLLVVSEAVILYLMLKLFSMCLPVKSSVLVPVTQTLGCWAVVQSLLVVTLNKFALAVTCQSSLLSLFLQIIHKNKAPRVLNHEISPF